MFRTILNQQGRQKAVTAPTDWVLKWVRSKMRQLLRDHTTVIAERITRRLCKPWQGGLLVCREIHNGDRRDVVFLHCFMEHWFRADQIGSLAIPVAEPVLEPRVVKLRVQDIMVSQHWLAAEAEVQLVHGRE